MATLEDRLDSFAEAWRPEAAGDKLMGRVVSVDMRDSEYGDPYPIVTVETDDGTERAFHGFHTIARRELAKQKPQIGDRIGIAYHGRGEPAKPGMNGAELYRVIVEKPEPEPVDWDAIVDGDPGPDTDANDPGVEPDLAADDDLGF
jgi:hypothetical protein